MTKMYNTGADYALSIIGGKWKPVILYQLANHPRRTGELVKQLGTSHKVLSDQLRELSDAGIVARKSYNTIPPHVEYSLTDEGENLYAALRYLNYWGEQQVDQISLVIAPYISGDSKKKGTFDTLGKFVNQRFHVTQTKKLGDGGVHLIYDRD